VEKVASGLVPVVRLAERCELAVSIRRHVNLKVSTGANPADKAMTLVAAMCALWQVSHPTPTLAELYAQHPRWGHVALDFEPRLTRLLHAVAVGATVTDGD
jgi:hypothetical protein